MDRQPLHNLRVVVTRPRAQAEALCARLHALGAVPVVFPAIRIVPALDTTALDRAIRRLPSYDWVIFTSVNGVAVFWQRLHALEREAADFASIRVAAVGSQTAQSLVECGVTPAFVPTEYVAEQIVEGLGDIRGRDVLLPQGQLARRTIERLLREWGARVEAVTLYQTLQAEPEAEARAALDQGFDAVLFTSASTVRHFVDLIDDVAKARLTDVLIGCIGPITAQAARALGLTVHVVPAEYTTAALVDALASYVAHPIPLKQP